VADALTLTYWCARSIVTISGTVTAHFDAKGDLVSADKTSVVTIGSEADPQARHDLRLSHRAGSQEFDLRLAPDGRLAGAGYDDEGAGAAVIGATLSVVSLGATVAGAVLPALGIATKTTPPPQAAREHWDELEERQRQLEELIDRLQRRAIALAGAADADKPPAGLGDELKALDAALALIRGEETKVEAAMKDWRAKHFPDRTTTFTYAIAAGELAGAGEAPGTIEVDVEGLAGDIRDAVDKLHTLVQRIEDPVEPPPPAEDEDEVIFYRLPRRVDLAVYELAFIGSQPAAVRHGDANDTAAPAPVEDPPPLSGVQRFHLRQMLPLWILDARCETHTVPITHSLFGKHAATLEFGDAGALSHIANTDTGGVGNVASAITSALGGSSASAPSPAGGSSGDKAGLAASTDPTLAALQAEVTLRKLEADLATANKTIRDSQ
jgi:hypothetical protein